MSLQTRDYLLVLGPPGAGKTSLLRVMIEAHVALGRRVLVSAGTNRAVDQVVRKLIEGGLGSKVVRMGTRHSMASDVHACSLEGHVPSRLTTCRRRSTPSARRAGPGPLWPRRQAPWRGATTTNCWVSSTSPSSTRRPSSACSHARATAPCQALRAGGRPEPAARGAHLAHSRAAVLGWPSGFPVRVACLPGAACRGRGPGRTGEPVSHE